MSAPSISTRTVDFSSSVEAARVLSPQGKRSPRVVEYSKEGVTQRDISNRIIQNFQSIWNRLIAFLPGTTHQNYTRIKKNFEKQGNDLLAGLACLHEAHLTSTPKNRYRIHGSLFASLHKLEALYQKMEKTLEGKKEMQMPSREALWDEIIHQGLTKQADSGQALYQDLSIVATKFSELFPEEHQGRESASLRELFFKHFKPIVYQKVQSAWKAQVQQKFSDAMEAMVKEKRYASPESQQRKLATQGLQAAVQAAQKWWEWESPLMPSLSSEDQATWMAQRVFEAYSTLTPTERGPFLENAPLSHLLLLQKGATYTNHLASQHELDLFLNQRIKEAHVVSLGNLTHGVDQKAFVQTLIDSSKRIELLFIQQGQQKGFSPAHIVHLLSRLEETQTFLLNQWEAKNQNEDLLKDTEAWQWMLEVETQLTEHLEEWIDQLIGPFKPVWTDENLVEGSIKQLQGGNFSEFLPRIRFYHKGKEIDVVVKHEAEPQGLLTQQLQGRVQADPQNPCRLERNLGYFRIGRWLGAPNVLPTFPVIYQKQHSIALTYAPGASGQKALFKPISPQRLNRRDDLRKINQALQKGNQSKAQALLEKTKATFRLMNAPCPYRIHEGRLEYEAGFQCLQISLESASLRSSLVWTQIVDALTGHQDRNPSNLVYVPQEAGGFMAFPVDNDECLGEQETFIIDPKEATHWHRVHLPTIVDTRMAQAIQRTTPQNLDSLLSELTLPANSIASAKKRLEMLQNHVQQLQNNGQVIAPSEWGDDAKVLRYLDSESENSEELYHHSLASRLRMMAEGKLEGSTTLPYEEYLRS